MDNIKDYFEKIKTGFKNIGSKKSAFILMLGLIGILLIGLSELFPEQKNEEKVITKEKDSGFSEKEAEIEKRIEDAVSKIKGAGKTEVTVMLESSEEYFYAENSSESSGEKDIDTESEYVIIDGENGEKPLLIKTKEAEIRGVLVVCEGGENAFVKERIIEAICALLDIPSNRVSVAEMA